ncbi:hypothetical protein ACTXG7_11600 [Mycolicibacterium sp. Dal123E01]|uniref:hypothetical protein n=1 Tax=Mycolicibacterium sp. Dal123E01 TaxID=3457578 RepID=UPI00403EA926
MDGLHLDHCMLAVADVNNKVYPAIVGKWPVDLITEERDPAGEEKFPCCTQAEVAGGSPA